jgi:hypothetical protein
MDIIDALKLIIAKSPRAAEEAVRTIAAVRNNSPVVQIRYATVLTRALADPEAYFSLEERELLASMIEAPDSSGRDFTFRLRLTDSERAALQAAADETGMSMSEYARRKIFSE